MNKIRNEKGEGTTDNAEIQRIIRDYYEQLYGNKIDNLEEMDRFLEKFNLPRLKQGEIEIMYNPITSTEIEAVIKKKSPKKQKPRTRCGEGNGNPLQYSCLENPRNGGAWWVAVYGVAQSNSTEAT